MKQIFVLLMLIQLSWSVVAQQHDSAQTKKQSANVTSAAPARVTIANIQSSQPPTPSLTSASESIRTESPATGAAESIKQTDFWQTVFNGLLVLITFGLLVMGYRQERVLRDSIAVAQKAASVAELTVETMKDTTARQLRAYALVQKITVKNIGVAGGVKQFVHIEIKNFGNIPAQNVIYWVDFASEKIPMFKHPGKADGIVPAKVAVIAPGDTFIVRSEIPFGLSGFEIEAGKEAVFIFGQFTYNDGFNDGRITDFMWMRTGAGWTSDGDMDICRDGNDFT